MRDDHRTLLLLRHAKSDYPPAVADHDRPLAPRGVREAGLAGDWLRADPAGIDLVLCSTANRARQTLKHTRVAAPVRYVERLYDAVPGTVIDEINRVGEDVGTLLVVGHQPSISQVALVLAGTRGSASETAERIAWKFPTSGIAVLRVGCSWDQLGPEGAELTEFHVPR